MNNFWKVALTIFVVTAAVIFGIFVLGSSRSDSFDLAPMPCSLTLLTSEHDPISGAEVEIADITLPRCSLGSNSEGKLIDLTSDRLVTGRTDSQGMFNGMINMFSGNNSFCIHIKWNGQEASIYRFDRAVFSLYTTKVNIWPATTGRTEVFYKTQFLDEENGKNSKWISLGFTENRNPLSTEFLPNQLLRIKTVCDGETIEKSMVFVEDNKEHPIMTMDVDMASQSSRPRQGD